MSQLQEKYKKEVVSSLMKSLSLQNIMEVPRLEKVVLNVCISEAVKTPNC